MVNSGAKIPTPALPSRLRPAAMLGISLLIVALIGFLSWQTGQQALSSEHERTVSRGIRDSAIELLSTVKDAETGQRGFLLTGRDEYLRPYRSAVTALPAIVTRLWSWTSGRPHQVSRVRQLEGLVDLKMAELRETVELAREQRMREAFAEVDSDEGRALMDQVRRLSSEIATEAQATEDRFRASSEESSRRLRIISIAGSLALFVFLVLSARTVFQEIARRDELFQQAHASRELLAITLGSIGDAVIATDNLMRITFINGVAQSLTGYGEPEAVGQSLSKIFRIVDETTREPVQNPLAQALAEGKTAGLSNHTCLIDKDGRQISIDDSAAPVRNPEGHLVGAVLVFRDITERRAAERALAESEEFARLAVESSPDCVEVLDLEGCLLSMNSNGRAQREIDDFSLYRLAPWSDFWQSELDKALAAVKAAQSGQTKSFKGYCPTAKGTPRWWEVILAPILDSRGLPVRILAVSRDITERTMNERLLAAVHRQLEDRAKELRRSNEDLTRFAYAASHDLRSPLNTVQSFAELLAHRFAARLGNEEQELLGYITGAVERMQRLITDLLAFTTAGGGEPGTNGVHADSNQVLSTVLTDLKGELHAAHADIQAEPLPPVAVQETHLHQLLQNIIGNALKYRGEAAPRIRVQVSSQGNLTQFRISDNGAGIDPKHREEIFQPFRRLHGNSISGSGIGLATCRRIVSAYGGSIWVESQPGVGSTFFFTLPPALAAPVVRKQTLAARAPAGAGQTDTSQPPPYTDSANS